MSVLQKTQYQVALEGTLVKLQFGNVPIMMDYNTALEIAQHLRIMGRRAKTLSGDKSFTILSRGFLSDAEGDEKLVQSLRDATAHFKQG